MRHLHRHKATWDGDHQGPRLLLVLVCVLPIDPPMPEKKRLLIRITVYQSSVHPKEGLAVQWTAKLFG